MSKKYVPSFLRDQQSTSNTTSTTVPFWPGQPTTLENTLSTNNNRFAVLSDDFPTNKPIINTSKPAREAPKLAPMTLASATSNGAIPMGGAGGPSVLGAEPGSKKSFASRFAEQAKIANNPNYKPPPKPINFQSEEDFPSLGGKPVNKVIAKSEVATGATGATGATSAKFADLAKGWAKYKEDEEERIRMKAEHDEKLRREADRMRSIPILGGFRRTTAAKDDCHNEDKEDEYDPNYEESSLGDDDSYEVPEGNGEPSDEDDENGGEFNSDVGWDGRIRGDLY